MPRILLVAALALAGLLALTAAAQNGGRADPALTRSNSVMPPRTPVLY